MKATMPSEKKAKNYIVGSTKTTPWDIKDVARMLMQPSGGLDLLAKKIDKDFESIKQETTLIDCLTDVSRIYVNLISDYAGAKDENIQLMSVVTELQGLIRRKEDKVLSKDLV